MAKSLAKKAERSDLKKLVKEMSESKKQDRDRDVSQSHASNAHRTRRDLDTLDPENSSAANATHIRSLTTDVEMLKRDVVRVCTQHVDSAREISCIRDDLENEVKQVRAQITGLGTSSVVF